MKTRKQAALVALGIAILCSALLNIFASLLPSPTRPTIFHENQVNTTWGKLHHDRNSTVPDQLCFVTAEFSETTQDADELPLLDPSMIHHQSPSQPRHFVFTNLPDLAIGNGWNKIVLQNLNYRRMITKSRWPKFLGWQHPSLHGCQVIFYGDAYILNPINESAWQYMARQILQSPAGLMQAKQIGSNNKPVKGPVVELWKNARMGKVSWQAANATIEWLRNQPDYKPMGGTPVYKNALFGYNPHNLRFCRMSQDFWQEYSKEVASWRDQPYWAYFLSKHDMIPLKFPFTPPMGPGGERGHNGHIYVFPSNAIPQKP